LQKAKRASILFTRTQIYTASPRRPKREKDLFVARARKRKLRLMKSILVVDDEPMIPALVGAALKADGCE
jgi:PleD family two-component response regulator